MKMCTNNKNSEVPIKPIPTDERTNSLKNLFIKEFHGEPSFYVRVPGRVNIIGEHIDYCGYPVLPMALEQDILVAARLINQSELQLKNVNEKYSNYDILLGRFENIEINNDINGKPFWYNYVLCGIKGAMEHLNNKFDHGLQMLIDGNIPPASGLSSSSALVSAACLAFLYAQNVNLNKTTIASLCASSERYVGTQGGGMDQAIAFLAEKYSAQYITWNPLNATPVALPEDATFVVAHSLAEANKAATNDFNRRVIECRLAAKILGKANGVSLDSKIITLSQVQKLLDVDLEHMQSLVYKYLPKNNYTKDEISRILDVTEEELESLFLTPNTRHLTDFSLKQRALHVYEEAMRVESFRKICDHTVSNGYDNLSNGVKVEKNHTNGNNDSVDALKDLGMLISSSHESLKLLYECSHENLDKLVDISKKNNIHSRLTGAGWGGCIVALCPKNQLDNYIDTLKEEFYKNHCNDDDEINKYVFATTPNYGAVIYK